MPKFLHTADWQIGRQYGQFDPEDAVPLSEARISTVEQIAKLAVAENVAAVLVAGDVFDAQTVSDKTIRRLFNALAVFEGPWIMIPGNHDAALAESVWSRAQRLQAIPSNVHALLQPQVKEFADLGFVVLAAPLTQRHTYNDLTEFFDSATTGEGLLRIGLAHGCVQGVLPEGIDSANPIALDRAQRAQLHYLALGDWHGMKSIDVRTWYSGTPEPDRFKNNDAGHVLLVDVPSPTAIPTVTPIPLGQFVWQSLQESLAVSTDVDRVVERLEAVSARDVVSLSLQGTLDFAGREQLELAAHAAAARARYFALDMTGLRWAPTEADISNLQADGYLSEVIADLRDRQQQVDGSVAGDALGILAAVLLERKQQGAVA